MLIYCPIWRSINYRTVSILPAISKILERLVFNQLYKFLNDNSLLSKHQLGFRPKNSTLTALIQMCDEWYQNMDNRKLNGVVFLDIPKAFDLVDHQILLRKIKTQFGLRNIEFDWFAPYLTNRGQVCIINGSISSSKIIKAGVPQGSILGPLLFLFYINDLPECLQRTTPCLYADDTQIFASSANYGELIDSLNHDLGRISHWLAKNRLQHHPIKTKVIIIGSNYSLNNKVYDYPVRLNGKLISRTNFFECLGVVLDERLRWDLHVEKTCKKVGGGIAVMKAISTLFLMILCKQFIVP